MANTVAATARGLSLDVSGAPKARSRDPKAPNSAGRKTRKEGHSATLESAEAGVTAATEVPATIERFEPRKVLPRAREAYLDLVGRFESEDDVSGTREPLK